MGISGLATYISDHSKRFLEDYALHDTYLVIDANSIACRLYIWHASCNSTFGGDYDTYAQCVTNFFDELLICNVTPLVLIDGGCEDKKLKHSISRTKEKIRLASKYKRYSERKREVFPFFIKQIFKDIMIKKGINYAHCLFEADPIIAAVARILDCPVLSYDSDFYIYGSLYIPFNTWKNNIVPNPRGRGYMKYCKIYYIEKLFQVYNGLNQILLPVAAILIGNDYVNRYTFRNFPEWKLPQTGKKKYNKQHLRIDATFNWLRRLNLNQAVIEILSRLRKQERKHVLNIIETMINSYMNVTLSMLLDVLHMLNVSTENFSKARLQNVSTTFKFEEDIYNLTYIGEGTNEISNDDDDEIDKEIASILAECSNESLVNNLPQWFINEIKLGKCPSYFIDIIVRKLYVCPTQIEDYSYASSIVASLDIISVIYGLLMSGIEERKTCMKYMTREKETLKCYQLAYDKSVFNCKLPLLSNLREVSMSTRIGILNNTLRISNKNYNKLKNIPLNWRLYIATIKYWINQEEEPFKLNCYIYSLLFAMLFNIIDHKIGFHRDLHKFHHRFDKFIENIQNMRKVENCQPIYRGNATLIQALHEVDRHDCWIVAPFFVSNFETDKKLESKDFNITIVHGFAKFQNCLRHSMDLNALLGYPYEQTEIATLFNGTLLYNMCNNFKKCDNIEEYINTVLQNSPSLLRLFSILLSNVRPFFGMLLKKEVGINKKTGIYEGKKEENTRQEEHEKKSEGSEEIFWDVNNRFSILCAV